MVKSFWKNCQCLHESMRWSSGHTRRTPFPNKLDQWGARGCAEDLGRSHSVDKRLRSGTADIC